MVEDLTVAENGKTVEKKFLYLTDKQAAMFDEESVWKCVQALDLGEPKCVIRLAQSVRGKQSYTSHKERTKLPQGVWFTSIHGCELDGYDQYIGETQLNMFMENCLLPLAMRTSALIVIAGGNDCSLAAALERVVKPEQARLGKNCPFTVLGLSHIHEVYAKAVTESNSLAGELLRCSSMWGKRRAALVRFMEARNKPLDQCQQLDLSRSASHLIIFESIDFSYVGAPAGRSSYGAQMNFMSLFLGQLNQKFPSILIQAYHADMGINQLAEHVRKKVPVFLLDTRERLYVDKKKSVTHLARLADSFPTFTAEEAAEMTLTDNDGLTLDSRKKLLEVAMNVIRRESQVYVDHARNCESVTQDLALLHRSLHLGSNRGNANEGIEELHERIANLQSASRLNKDGGEEHSISQDLLIMATNFMVKDWPKLYKVQKLRTIESWLEKHDESHELYGEAIIQQTNLSSQIASIDEHGSSGLEHLWLDYYHLLGSPLTFSGPVMDIDYCKGVLNSVVRVDRLPKSNSLQALHTLQDAWDNIEFYHTVADGYKRITKVSYFILLTTGVITTIVAQMSNEMKSATYP